MKQNDLFILQAGAKELLQRSLSQFEIDQFLKFFSLLKKWNAVFNLTAIKKTDLIVRQHFLDCLSLVPVLSSLGRNCILDVGSGAGFPGLVVAIVNPKLQVFLIEISTKKAVFLNQVVSILGLKNVYILNSKIEDVKIEENLLSKMGRLFYPAITCRGFSSLKFFFNLTLYSESENCVWIAMKGKYPSQELQELKSSDLVIKTIEMNIPFLDAKRHMVIFSRNHIEKSIF